MNELIDRVAEDLKKNQMNGSSFFISCDKKLE